MAYQWDKTNAQANRRKHGASFADAVAVFEDDWAITIPDDYPDEARFATIGRDMLGRILIVVHTWRGDDIRIISARKAARREKEQYEG